MHTQYNNIQHKKRVISKGALENHFFCPVGLFLPTSLVSAAPQSSRLARPVDRESDPCVSCVRVHMPNVRAMRACAYDYVTRAYDMSHVHYDMSHVIYRV